MAIKTYADTQTLRLTVPLDDRRHHFEEPHKTAGRGQLRLGGRRKFGRYLPIAVPGGGNIAAVSPSDFKRDKGTHPCDGVTIDMIRACSARIALLSICRTARSVISVSAGRLKSDRNCEAVPF